MSISHRHTVILTLNIETGRYKNIKDNVTGRLQNLRPEERTCDVCNSNETEDEFHFLCICPLYSDERSKLFESIGKKFNVFRSLIIEDTFVFTLQYCNVLLSRFLANAWSIRRNYLYK